MRSRAALALSLASAAVLVSLATGCSQSAAREQLSEIRADPSPELMTLTQREDDVDNQLTVTFDTNLRSFNRDLGVLFLLNRPSHLSPAPIR